MRRGVGLLAIPGALGPERADQLGEAGHLAGHRVGQARDPERGEVVGVDDAIEVVPGHLDDRLVGQAEALEDHDGRAVVDAQLDVREHVGLVALPDQQRAG